VVLGSPWVPKPKRGVSWIAQPIPTVRPWYPQKSGYYSSVLEEANESVQNFVNKELREQYAYLRVNTCEETAPNMILTQNGNRPNKCVGICYNNDPLVLVHVFFQ